MEVDMRKEQLEAITYRQYTAWLYDVYLKIPKDLGFLTYDKALELATKERVLRKKEERSIIQKILGKLNLVPCNTKHVYEHYDLALTIMNYLDKYQLTKEDVDLARTEEFYEKYFKEKLIDYQRYRYSYAIDALTKEEYKQCQKHQKELFKKAIPPYGDIDYSKIVN